MSKQKPSARDEETFIMLKRPQNVPNLKPSADLNSNKTTQIKQHKQPVKSQLTHNNVVLAGGTRSWRDAQSDAQSRKKSGSNLLKNQIMQNKLAKFLAFRLCFAQSKRFQCIHLDITYREQKRTKFRAPRPMDIGQSIDKKVG